jgi:hypothetical protein
VRNKIEQIASWHEQHTDRDLLSLRTDKHVLPPDTTDFKAASDKAHVYLATASADRLDLFQPLTVQDLRLSGHVCFAGNSSMEVFIKMEGLREGGEPETLMLGACARPPPVLGSTVRQRLT